jgi:hypothetical protein
MESNTRMTGLRIRRPSNAQRPILDQIVDLGGADVRRADITEYAPVGSWVAIESAGWVTVDRGTETQRGGNPSDYLYTLTPLGWAAIARECQWFAGCTNVATGSRPHPVMAPVPICDRCRARLTN